MHFGGEDPLGRRIKLSADGGAAGSPPRCGSTIVGVRRPSASALDRGRAGSRGLSADARYAPASTVLMIRTEATRWRSRRCVAGGIARHRSRPSGLRHPDHGSAAGAAALGVPDLRIDVRDLRRDRARLVSRGLYAVTGVFGLSADPGNRGEDGARRQASQVQWLILRRPLVHLGIGLVSRHRRGAASADCSTACWYSPGSRDRLR